jgi:cell division protein FtsW (lipid II flippase)
LTNILRRPRLLGLGCGALAVMAGLTYLSLAGAPSAYLLVNLLALALGAAVWAALGRTASSRLPGAGAAVLVLATGLLATALFGVAVNGAARWIQLGPISVQTSLVLVPAMIVLFARRPDVVGAAAAIAGSVWTLVAPDTLPAVPFVDQVFFSAFGVHPLAGAVVVTGAVVLLVPAVARISGREVERAAPSAFGACWLVVIAAAALGNYPTPLVGYGGSAVLGYLLSVALLPSGARDSSSELALDRETAGVPGRGEPLSRLGLVRSGAPC